MADKSLILVYIAIAGIWGLLVKIASGHLNSSTMAFVALTSAWLTVSAFSCTKLSWQSTFGIVMAIVSGCVGGLTSVLFYYIVKRNPISTVIPLSTLYVVVTIALSCIFLGEPISLKKSLGIAFGLIAIALLVS